MGNEQPVVICQQCQGFFCYRHKVGWHFEHTCEEYDRFMEDHSFRSQSQRKRDEEDVLESQSRELERQITIADEEWRRGLLKKGDEAKLGQIERERRKREQREREAALRAEQRRREEEAEARRRADREAEERLGRQTAETITQKCPNCREGVQKTFGW